MHYFAFNIPTWSLHTSHLSLEEEAVYFRLLNYYYDTELPLPKEMSPVIRRMRLNDVEGIVKAILSEYFTLEDDGYHNHRADFEISEYRKKADRARTNGKRGGRPKQNSGIETQSVSVANPEETGSKANQEQITNNKEQITKNQFKKPTVSQVKQYAEDINFVVDAEHFIDYYTIRGWEIDNQPIKDWKACVRTWKRNRKRNRKPTMSDDVYVPEIII